MGFAKLDVFPKLDNEYRVGTAVGGMLSVFSLLATVVLAFVEIHSHLHPQTRQRLYVNAPRLSGPDGSTITPSTLPRFNVFFNITFPRLPCYSLHWDVLDGITQIPLPLESASTTYRRISSKGIIIGETPDVFSIDQSEPFNCGTGKRENCRTCRDIIQASQAEKNLIQIHAIPQCEKAVERMKSMTTEGCEISSKFQVAKVASNFHVSPGISYYSDGSHLHDYRNFNLTNMNNTHTVNRLQFSETNRSLPLDGFSLVQEQQGAWSALYTVDILDDKFSVSRYSSYNQRGQLPGVQFQYDISPISATAYLDTQPVLHLVGRLITVIGGVLGLFRFLDSVLYYTSKKSPVKITE